MRTRSAVTALALAALGATGLTAAASASVANATTRTATPAAGRYTAVTPTRVLDTRHHIGVATTAPVAAGHTVSVTVAGPGHRVPAGASSVGLNVTATGGTRSGFVTVFGGSARPVASTLSYPAGGTTPNLVIAPLDSKGAVRLYNGSAGSVHLLADVSGYYAGGTVSVGQQGAFGSVAPTRVLDTRKKTGVTTTTPVKPGGTVSFTVEGAHGVPANVAAVALNITATAGTLGGFVAAYASQSPRPATSNLTYAKGQSVATLAVARTGGDGKVTLYNGSSGTVHLIADVQGYYTAGDPVTAGNLAALPPARALGATTVAAGKTLTLHLAGAVGVPLTHVSTAILTVTATKATRSGFLTVYQGLTRPHVSNLNYVAGRTATNLVAAPVSSSGTVTVYNGSAGSVRVLADIAGYVPNADPPLPPTSTAHYVRSVSAASGKFADPTAAGVGCADAHAGDRFVLLDIGAQLNDRTGVQLSATSTNVSYDDLVSAINNYVTSYQLCRANAVEIAVGTNNSGDFDMYSATERGADWAAHVINAVATPAGVTFAGANDIEAAFSSTEAQAQQWETAFLNATTTTSTKLIFNGSADGCPNTYGAAPAPCDFGWTQANYYALTHRADGRIDALPQIYVAYQARQWANIARVAGNDITFRGSLTEHAAGCTDLCDMVPPQGWAFLYHALSTVVATPTLPLAADLDVLS